MTFSLLPRAMPSFQAFAPLQNGCRTPSSRSHPLLLRAAADSPGSLGASVKRVFQQVQGALPIVGLLSRLTAPSGFATDDLAYPEFCRATYDSATESFNYAAADWEKMFGKEGGRKYVMLCLWMARTGGGVVPGRNILMGAKRVRVTQDLEVEMDRFEAARAEATKKYEYLKNQRGGLQDQIDVAVDSLCAVSIGSNDGEAIPDTAAEVLVHLVAGAFYDVSEAEERVRESIQRRAERRLTYT